MPIAGNFENHVGLGRKPVILFESRRAQKSRLRPVKILEGGDVYFFSLFPEFRPERSGRFFECGNRRFLVDSC